MFKSSKNTSVVGFGGGGRKHGSWTERRTFLLKKCRITLLQLIWRARWGGAHDSSGGRTVPVVFLLGLTKRAVRSGGGGIHRKENRTQLCELRCECRYSLLLFTRTSRLLEMEMFPSVLICNCRETVGSNLGIIKG